MTPLLLVGAGGHCRSCIDVVERSAGFRVHGIVVAPDETTTAVFEYPVLGTDDDLARLLQATPDALVTVGQVRSAVLRTRLFGLLEAAGARPAIVVSPLAHVSARATLAPGVIVMHGAVVNSGAGIGRNGIVNSMALVEHDVVVGDHCHVSTGVRINGGVRIGAGSFIGSGAVIREGVAIGEGVVVGAGCVVLHDVPNGTTVRARR